MLKAVVSGPVGNRRRSRSALAGLALDMLVGEPAGMVHPVVGFGSLMEGVERRLYRDRRWAGVLHTIAGTTMATATGAAIVRVSGWGVATSLATYVAVASKELRRAASEVESCLIEGDVDAARRLLPALVGRDPSGLDENEIVRAVVESVGENTVDAVVAPVFWAVLGGAPTVLAYRAVNTMDAMVGHRSPRYRRYGWASARLDDLANLAPARLTAILVGMVRPTRATEVRRAVRDQAPAHPSPNAGVAEAAFAGALGVRLGGTNRYGRRTEVRPVLGCGGPPEPGDISAALRLSRDVTTLTAGLLACFGWWDWLSRRRR